MVTALPLYQCYTAVLLHPGPSPDVPMLLRSCRWPWQPRHMRANKWGKAGVVCAVRGEGSRCMVRIMLSRGPASSSTLPTPPTLPALHFSPFAPSPTCTALPWSDLVTIVNECTDLHRQCEEAHQHEGPHLSGPYVVHMCVYDRWHRKYHIYINHAPVHSGPAKKGEVAKPSPHNTRDRCIYAFPPTPVWAHQTSECTYHGSGMQGSPRHNRGNYPTEPGAGCAPVGGDRGGSVPEEEAWLLHIKSPSFTW